MTAAFGGSRHGDRSAVGRFWTRSGSCAERRVACVGIAASSVKLEQAYVGVVQSSNGVTIAQRRRTRPEMPVETELNGVDVLRVRPEGRFGCRLNRRLSTFILVRDGLQSCGETCPDQV